MACVGEIGPVGPQGELGPQGIAGATGPQGDVGPQGLRGERGTDGLRGDVGAEGPEGAQGPQGEAGPQGEPGVPGPQGEAGSRGPQGEAGTSGAQGERGPQGRQGFPGTPPNRITGLVEWLDSPRLEDNILHLNVNIWGSRTTFEHVMFHLVDSRGEYLYGFLDPGIAWDDWAGNAPALSYDRDMFRLRATARLTAEQQLWVKAVCFVGWYEHEGDVVSEELGCQPISS